jgi:hypothetical protein
METCDFLDHMPSDLISSVRKAARQIHNASQSVSKDKKDKVKRS